MVVKKPAPASHFRVLSEGQPCEKRLFLTSAAIGAVFLLSFAWIWPLRSFAVDSLAVHMLQHLITMNFAGPLLAAAFSMHCLRYLPSVILASILQIALFLTWHVPSVFTAAHHSTALTFLMHGSLLFAAFVFWSSLWRSDKRTVWRTVFALLLCGKILCLFGAILIFSRRILYGPHRSSGGLWNFHTGGSATGGVVNDRRLRSDLCHGGDCAICSMDLPGTKPPQGFGQEF